MAHGLRTVVFLFAVWDVFSYGRWNASDFRLRTLRESTGKKHPTTQSQSWLVGDVHKETSLDEINGGEVRVKEGKNGKLSHVEDLVVSLRKDKKHSINTLETEGNAVNSSYPNPFEEKLNAGSPCPMKGLVVRREMGELGVTSFQIVAAKLIMYALGPSWSYYDDWPKLTKILIPDRHISKEEANQMRQIECKRQVTLNPSEQSGLILKPFNITDGSWVKSIREKVCGKDAKWNHDQPDSYVPTANEPCIVVKLQRHWQHTGFYYRYREFIASNVLRSYESMRKEYVLGLEAPDSIDSKWQGKVADLVVYLRLGDKSVAGDTILTFESGYYDVVLEKTRPKAKTCWIVTQTVEEDRARGLAARHKCSLVSSPKQYTDWTLLLTAPGTLVMAASTFIYFQALIGAAKEVHYPAVGFFHDKHNVCMRERNVASHFGQIRLPIDDKKMVYHDIYSRVWFMTYDELAAEVAALPCSTILDQHLCDFEKNSYKFGGESRYCYRPTNTSTLSAQKQARKVGHKIGLEALKKFKSQ